MVHLRVLRPSSFIPHPSPVLGVAGSWRRRTSAGRHPEAVTACPASRWEAHSYQNLLDLVTQYERTDGARHRAHVVVTYSIRGRASRQWQWPSSS